MGKYQVFADVDPGPHIVKLAVDLIENLSTVDSVSFVKWHELTDENIGVYFPDKKAIMIDLGNILNNADLYRFGMNFIPAVFFTTLWALFHEVAHGHQVHNEPQLAKLHRLPTDYEIAAQVTTKDNLLLWANANAIPPVNTWGWLGEHISELINAQYAQKEFFLLDELDALRAGAVAKAEHILAIYEFQSKDLMYSSIDSGEQGLKIDSIYYLTAPDFFGLDRTNEAVARSAQTVFMG